MGPRQTRFWLPLTRLGAFFVAVVVAGNVLLHALRPEIADHTSTPDRSVDYFAKKKKRLERQFYRTMEKFLGAPAVAPPKEKMSGLPAAEQAGDSPAAPASARAPEPLPATATASLTPVAPPPSHAPQLGYFEPDIAAFIWPSPLPPVNLSRGLELPTSVTMLEEATFRADLVSDLYRRNARDPVADVGDSILRVPEALIDGFFLCTSSMGSRPAIRSWDDDTQRSMLTQILDVQAGNRQERIWAEFMRQFTDREVKYFANFGDSRVDTWGFQDGTEEANQRELLLDQRKVLWDALRRTYVSRYKVQADERIREDAWYLDRWSGADFVVLPPLMAGYIFYRGLEKRFSIAGSKLLLSIEPVSEWYRPTKHDLAAAIALEWTMKDCPLGVIVSAGLHDGRYGLDFIGIGTSLGAVRRALVMQQGERP
jgi:hypothetical protein